MSYRLVQGEFALTYHAARRVGSRPDGDSVWFRPDNPQRLKGVGGRDADFNGGGLAQLRFEGIDALELHYPPSTGDHQHMQCVAARDFLLRNLGFTDVQYARSDGIQSYVQSSTPAAVRGYILTRGIDPYGRPVAFVFSGVPPEADGDDVFLTVARMNQSLNAQLAGAGQVYPAYYSALSNGQGGLPVDLRMRLTALVTQARADDFQVWAVDSSRRNRRVQNQADLQALAIWPKLYRRLITYLKGPPAHNGLRQFDAWLRADSDRDDQIWIVPTAELGNLHDVIILTTGDRIRMRYWPEDLIVVPR